MAKLLELSDEILIEIASYLYGIEILKTERTAKKWANGINNDLLWYMLIKRELNLDANAVNKSSYSAKNIYKNLIHESLFYCINQDTKTYLHRLNLHTKTTQCCLEMNTKITGIFPLSRQRLVMLDNQQLYIYSVNPLMLQKTIPFKTKQTIFNIIPTISELDNNQLCLSYSSYGGYEATAAFIINIDSGTYKMVYSAQSDVSGIFYPNPQTVLPDGRIIFQSCHPDMVTVLDNKKSFNPVEYWIEEGTICSIKAIDAKTLAIGWEKGLISFIDTDTFKPKGEILLASGSICFLIPLPGQRLVSGSDRGEVIIWDLQTSQILCKTLIEKRIRYLDVVFMNKLMITTARQVLIWDWLNNKHSCLATLPSNSVITTQTKLSLINHFYINTFQETFFKPCLSTTTHFWEHIEDNSREEVVNTAQSVPPVPANSGLFNFCNLM